MKACIFHDTSDALHDRRVFEIVEEAYNRRAEVLVFAGSKERAAEIDRILWIIRQDSFIPHQIIGENEETVSVPVAIVTEERNPLRARILIADGHCSLKFSSGFDLVHEFVYHASPGIKETCRKRYKSYKDGKVPVEYLKTGVWKGQGQKNM